MPHRELLVLGPLARLPAGRVGHRRECSYGCPGVLDEPSRRPGITTVIEVQGH